MQNHRRSSVDHKVNCFDSHLQHNDSILRVVYRNGAQNPCVVVQAAFFRQLVASRCATDEKQSTPATADKTNQSADKQHSAVQRLGCSQSDLDGMLAESLRYAKGDVKRFVQETERAGWNVHPIMLSSFERMSFSHVS